MNTHLEKLFSQYNLPEKDRYDIRQIYSLMSVEKQRNLINNFATLAARLNIIESELQQERDLLLWNAIKNVEDTIELVKRELMDSK